MSASYTRPPAASENAPSGPPGLPLGLIRRLARRGTAWAHPSLLIGQCHCNRRPRGGSSRHQTSAGHGPRSHRASQRPGKVTPSPLPRQAHVLADGIQLLWREAAIAAVQAHRKHQPIVHPGTQRVGIHTERAGGRATVLKSGPRRPRQSAEVCIWRNYWTRRPCPSGHGWPYPADLSSVLSSAGSARLEVYNANCIRYVPARVHAGRE